MVVHGVDIDSLTDNQVRDVMMAMLERLHGPGQDTEVPDELKAELRRRLKLIREGKVEMLDVDDVIASL